MNKAELIEYLANKSKLGKSECKNVLDAFIEAVEKTLKKGNEVVLTGFGTFSVVQRKARKGINPATGKSINIPAKRVPKFKPGKELKEVVL